MMHVKAVWKWLLSFRKKHWELEDYPIRLKYQDPSNQELGPRFAPVVWNAQIVNWWQISGHGQTRDEAMAQLRESFTNYRQSHDALPRPGTGMPIEFASSVLVRQHEDIARDFLERILGLNYDECFISDESSLWDFHGEDDNAEYFRKIAIIYGVDVSDVPRSTLAGIFERIARHRAG